MKKTNYPLVVAMTEQVLSEFVESKTAFYSYDITKRVRERVGDKVEVETEDIQAVVRTAFLKGQMQDYAVVSGLYYHDSTEEDKASQSVPQTQSSNPLINAFNNSINKVNVKNKDINTHKVTYPAPVKKNTTGTKSLSVNDGVLRILKDTIKSAGLRSGERVTVLYSPTAQKLIISNNYPIRSTDPKAKTARLTVDVKDNLRINLNKLGVKEKTFLAVPNQNEIHISCG